MFRTFLFLALITAVAASETLDTFLNAASGFSAAIEQQLTTVQGDPSASEFAKQTLAYSSAKIAYYNALRAAMPELMAIATSRQQRPPEADKLARAFRLAGESRETAVDDATSDLLEHFQDEPEIQKARVEFACAQEAAEQFHRDFDGQDFVQFEMGTLFAENPFSAFNPSSQVSTRTLT